ncbi:Bacterial SH3 domain protein [compost metagenome]
MRLQVKVTASSLHIRRTPTNSAASVGFLNKGDTVTVIKEQNSFYYLSDARGWIGKKYTSLVKNLEASTPAKTNNNTKGGTTPKGTGGNTALAEKKVQSGASYEETAKLLGSATATDIYTKFEKDGRVATGVNEPGIAVQTYKYALDTSYLDDNMDIIRKNLNIVPSGGDYASTTDALFDQFNRFNTPFHDMYLSKGFGHVFFTRPNTNIVKSLGQGNLVLTGQAERDPLMYYIFQKHPKILTSLSRHYTAKHDFNIFLSNQAASFELSDEFIKTTEHGETLTGYKVQYGKNNIESNTAGTFSVNYQDDNNLTVYWMHKAWVDYISKVNRGEFSPIRDYVIKKILDYACSAYYILCGPDGETVIFWAKYFGVFPTSVPSSNLGWTKGTNIKTPEFAINYAYSYKEDGSPLTLAEFNMNSHTELIYKKTYEPEVLGTGRTLSRAPFIETVRGGPNRYRFKLRFRK